MSNKPRKTSDFSKLQQTPKFTDNQRITDIDICIFVHICIHSFHRRYTRFGAYPNCTHIKIFVKKEKIVRGGGEEGKNKVPAQIGTNVGARGFNAGLLARSQFASGRSCDRPTQSRFSIVFLGHRANAELVPKFHVALHASHATLHVRTKHKTLDIT
jgi:hypothetical protein